MFSQYASAFAASLFMSVLGVGCTQPGGDVGTSDEALTAAQCSYFATGDKVTICHHTGATRKPYSIIRTNVASCGGHADHDGDYIASTDPASSLYDPTCSGQGCLPEGAPTDGTVECCAGLTSTGGVCAPAALRIVDLKVITAPRTWLASGGCDGPSKLFVYAYGPNTLLNPGPHQGLAGSLDLGTHSYLFAATGYGGGEGTIEVTLSDGHTLSATGLVYGNAPAPPVTIGDRTYRITLFETTGHGEDTLGCETSGADGAPDLLGDLEVEVTSP